MKRLRHHKSRRRKHGDLLQRADRVMSSSKRLVVQRQLCAAKLHKVTLRAENRSELNWPSGIGVWFHRNILTRERHEERLQCSLNRKKNYPEPTGSGTFLSFKDFPWPKQKIPEGDFSWVEPLKATIWNLFDIRPKVPVKVRQTW